MTEGQKKLETLLLQNIEKSMECARLNTAVVLIGELKELWDMLNTSRSNELKDPIYTTTVLKKEDKQKNEKTFRNNYKN